MLSFFSPKRLILGRIASTIASVRALGERYWEDAQHYLQTLRIKMQDIPGTNYQLGVWYFQKQNFADASFRFALVCRFRPTHAMAWFYRGRCALQRGQREQAVRFMREALHHNHHLEEARFFLAWLRASPEAAVMVVPKTLIEAYTDQWIQSLSPEALQTEDGLNAPCSYLFQMLYPELAQLPTPWTVLDMGCHTGLMGCYFRAQTAAYTIIGVDLSNAALAVARQRRVSEFPVYHQLIQQDYQSFLAKDSTCYHVITASMVLHDHRDVGATLQSVAEHLLPGGLLAISVGRSEGNDVVLQPYHPVKCPHFCFPEAVLREAVAQTKLVLVRLEAMETPDDQPDMEPLWVMICRMPS